jgi:hypothetical protein
MIEVFAVLAITIASAAVATRMMWIYFSGGSGRKPPSFPLPSSDAELLKRDLRRGPSRQTPL